MVATQSNDVVHLKRQIRADIRHDDWEGLMNCFLSQFYRIGGNRSAGIDSAFLNNYVVMSVFRKCRTIEVSNGFV